MSLISIKLDTLCYPAVKTPLSYTFICFDTIPACDVMVTYEIKLFQNYFSLRLHRSEIILFQRVETCLKLFQNYFTGLLQLMIIFQRVYCR